MKNKIIQFTVILLIAVVTFTGCNVAIKTGSKQTFSQNSASNKVEYTPLPSKSQSVSEDICIFPYDPIEYKIYKTADIISPVPYSLGEASSKGGIPEYYEKLGNTCIIDVSKPVDSLMSSRMMLVFNSRNTVIEKRDTLEGLLCDDWAHTEGRCYVTDMLDNYSDEYFENNVLIFYHAYEACCNFTNWVEKLEIVDEVLVVSINSFRPSIGLTAIGEWNLEIQVKREDIKNIGDVKLSVEIATCPPSGIWVEVLPEYNCMVENKMFSIDDFGIISISSIEYFQYLNSFMYLKLAEFGTTNANFAARYLENLRFVKSVQIE